jgi:hypothetical protein
LRGSFRDNVATLLEVLSIIHGAPR